MTPAYLAFFAVCFFWGTTYFAIKISVETMPPFLLSGFRHLLAGGLILAYFHGVKRINFPPIQVLQKISIAAILLIVIANALICYAELYIPSGLAALIAALLPFYVLVVDYFWSKQEQLHGLQILGMVLGIVGVAILSFNSVSETQLTFITQGLFFALASNVAWALGSVYVKKKLNISGHSPFYLAGWQMVIAGVLTFLIAWLNGDVSAINQVSNASWIAMAYLAIFGSILGYGSYIYAISHLPVSLVSVHVYINPLVAVFLGVAFLNEPFTWLFIPAILCILLGVFFVNRPKT